MSTYPITGYAELKVLSGPDDDRNGFFLIQ